MLFSAGRIYHKITNNQSLLSFNYADGIISSILSTLTLCRDSFCIENINEKCFSPNIKTVVITGCYSWLSLYSYPQKAPSGC